MRSEQLDRALGAGVLVVAAFNTLAAVTMPVPARKPGALLVVVWIGLLLTHAVLYWMGARIRARFGLVSYVLAQAAIIFAIGLSGALFPVGVGLYVTLTVQAVILVGQGW